MGASSIRKNSLKWIVRLIERDLRDLERESVHLMRKGVERDLTSFERERLASIAGERELLRRRLLEIRPATDIAA